MSDRGSRSTPVLATAGLVRRFGGLVAVSEVSIALHEAELHALIGPNGAGKSTLVNLLSGDLKPTRGSISLDGREVAGEPAWRLAALGIGRSYQRTNIFPSLSMLENVRLAAQARATPWRRLLMPARGERILVERARAALARLGLAQGEQRIAGAVSHGEQRQLEIAMAVATEPRVLLLDEPLAGMGSEDSERMAGLLLELAREHAVLLIEHDMDVVFKVAHWMTVMVEGAVLAEGVPDAIRSNRAVQNAYLGGHA